jgi:hypothetical protein
MIITSIISIPNNKEAKFQPAILANSYEYGLTPDKRFEQDNPGRVERELAKE